MKKTAKDAGKEKTREREDGRGFERLEDFARRIVAVPKEKIEERERAYRQDRRKR